MCRREYLNYLRVREWQDFESQLRQVCKEMEIELGPARATTPDADGIHQALLSGLLSHIGLLEERDRKEARRDRGSTSAPAAPGSRSSRAAGCARKAPTYLMAGELVETGRLWARQNAAIEPEWAEQLGAHLVKRTYSEPHWSKKRAAVMAYERVTLYGVPLVADRLVNYGKIDPELSRELFIRHALVVRRVEHQPPLLPPQPRAARGGRGARAPRPAARHRRRRAHALRLLRRPGRRRGGQRRALRHLVEAGRRRRPGAAHLRPGDAHPRHRRARSARRTTPSSGDTARRADVPDQLPLRARRRGRRADHRRAGRAP